MARDELGRSELRSGLMPPAQRFRKVVAVVALVAMAAIVMVLASAVPDALADRNRTAITVVNGAIVDHILDPFDFDALSGPVAADFGVTTGGAVVFAAGERLHVIDRKVSGDQVADVELAGARPDSFALDPRGMMLTVADGYFGMLDESGQVLHSIPLPHANARLAPSVHDGTVFLFGPANDGHRLYRMIDDGTLDILLESNDPIVAVADSGSRTLVATSFAIYEINSERPEMLFNMSRDDPAGAIGSLGLTEDGVVFYATEAKVFALAGPHAVSIVNDSGGTLRVRDGVLYVLDPRRHLLFSVRPASRRLFDGGADD